jgi:FtsZ-binding cell division protein ZapB
LKPPSRKAHEKTEIERLKERIAKLEKKQPEALGIQATIDALRMQNKRLVENHRDLTDQLLRAGHFEAYFGVLASQEVFVAAEDGMKYLKGEDLVEYCKALIKKQDEERYVGYETINLDFKTFANQAISEIIRDEVDKMAGSQLDAYKYITKGRYDTRSQS